MSKQKRTPYDVNLDADAREQLAVWLCDQLNRALAVRSASEAEVAYWHVLYEQGRTRGDSNSPWPDAADLTSAIGTDKVDSLRARIMKTIFVEPVCTVEGWGDAATKAPFVEEFHQWQIEAEGFQSAFARAAHLSLIEPYGMLELYEDRIRRPVRKTIHAALALGPDGAALIGPDLKPVLQQNPDGTYVEAPPEQPGMPPIPSAETLIDDYELVCNGPRSREIPYRDCLILPAHARNRTEIWAYAKRFWRRVGELKERAAQGVYDETQVEELGTADERVSEDTLSGKPLGVAAKDDDLAEKELWEVTFLHELDGKGLRWWVGTIHKDQVRLLRLQYDDIGRPRYFPLVPFPRPASIEGYSLIGHKLITTIEENTAWRNMDADQAAMHIQVPIKRKVNALWDPDDEPWGPKAIITVREMNEVEPFNMPDRTQAGMEHIAYTERQGERLAGVADIASGVTPEQDRPLGETRLVTMQSEIRMDEVIRNIQETVEEIFQVRHLMWKRALAEQQDGMELPSSVLMGLETRGADISQYSPNRKFTVSLMEGAFRFKPKGSVETADKQRQRMDFNQSMQAIASLSQVNPMIGMILQTPGAAKALLEQWVRLFNVPDKQAFLGSEAMAIIQQVMMAQQMGMAPPGPPGTGPSAGPSKPGGPPPGPMGQVVPFSPPPARPQ
jgi:hypothetical protein